MKSVALRDRHQMGAKPVFGQVVVEQSNQNGMVDLIVSRKLLSIDCLQLVEKFLLRLVAPQDMPLRAGVNSPLTRRAIEYRAKLGQSEAEDGRA